MSHYQIDEWSVIENGFDPNIVEASESIFSIGNGHMGQRANFEESYSGKTLQGSYVAGIYYPDKTRVGWWKNGYPEYFAKVLNAPNWIGLDVAINGETLDLACCDVSNFRRELHMRNGILCRQFHAKLKNGCEVDVSAKRFVSMADREIGVVEYEVTARSSMQLILTPYLDGDVRNQDSNYDERFWNVLKTSAKCGRGYLLTRTKRLDFSVGCAMECICSVSARTVAPSSNRTDTRVENRYCMDLESGETAVLYKIVALTTSFDYLADEVAAKAQLKAAEAHAIGIAQLKVAHEQRWEKIWRHSDILIEGDSAAQQGIRFNIFHLNQTYTGEDARLNIGPKGFTGEKYGGCTYWDTEAFCIPFFLATATPQVSRNLLLYRYRHLNKAIENAKKLGFGNGAALFPMVTMNGEECHNEWEITFEEIHRNGAIAFAIYNYVKHTQDTEYLASYGLEVLIAIARFWSQRVSLSPEKKKYVILGVTGPNEYENNVNNNWYTNLLAAWCLRYAADVADMVSTKWPESFEGLVEKTCFKAVEETSFWRKISDHMYYPYDAERDIFLQQDGYLDKANVTVSDLDPSERPLNQHWSWDRILRSPFIKQADVMQGIYMFAENYDRACIVRHFDFYEARTVHESSLSACIYSILASRIGRLDKAYALYLRASRLDLDDYNCEVGEGLHITSMAGTWMSIVEGFGGKRMCDGTLFLSPQIPTNWKKYAFRLLLAGYPMQVTVTQRKICIAYEGPTPVIVNLYGRNCEISKNTLFVFERSAD